jgi:hypothetical protein
MGTEARKWKQGRSQNNRSKIEPGWLRPHDARRHQATAREFYRVCVLSVGGTDTVDKHRSHRHVMVPSALYSRLDSPR